MGVFQLPGNYVMSWTLCVLDFGGDKLERKGKYTGKIGVFQHYQRKRVEWVLEIYDHLI